MNVLSLFAGIGGLELGLERAGMTTVGQVELNPYCRSVLARHWPEVPRHDDVRTTPSWWMAEPRPRVDVVCGGFPCQPFSQAGSRRGTADERWGWPWFADVVRAVRPRYVVVENVAALHRDPVAFGWLLGDLAELGFDAQWSLLSACALGASHARERLFLVAHPPLNDGKHPCAHQEPQGRLRPEPRREGWRTGGHYRAEWAPEPPVGRVADGIPPRVVFDPLHALGNAVVPAVSEYIGRLIMSDHT